MEIGVSSVKICRSKFDVTIWEASRKCRGRGGTGWDGIGWGGIKGCFRDTDTDNYSDTNSSCTSQFGVG